MSKLARLEHGVRLQALSQLYRLVFHGQEHCKRLQPHLTTACRHASGVTKPKAVSPHKRKSESQKVKHFEDYRRTVAHGGNGGNGCMSFAREFCKEWAGPDGGNGGNGGHVIFQASTNCKSLAHLRSVVKGEDGIDGQGKSQHGKNAQHTYIQVPLGTVVKTDSGLTLGSLEKEDHILLVARGGAGGKGNRFFLSNQERAPAKAERGAKGQTLVLHVEMRTMAHAGLIGFPNAGKSTLLRAISRARPKVAAYPFTTLNPHVGIVLYDDYQQIAVADLPGLIAGAHRNIGLGLSFLKHIERCACLLYVLDLSSPQPLDQLEALRFELEQYQPGLSTRPHAIIANKLDLPHAQSALQELQRSVDLPVLAISAKQKIGIDSLLDHLRSMYDMYVTGVTENVQSNKEV